MKSFATINLTTSTHEHPNDGAQHHLFDLVFHRLECAVITVSVNKHHYDCPTLHNKSTPLKLRESVDLSRTSESIEYFQSCCLTVRQSLATSADRYQINLKCQDVQAIEKPTSSARAGINVLYCTKEGPRELDFNTSQ